MSGLADEKPKKVPDKYVDGQKIITIPVVGYEVKEKTYLLVMELFLSFMAIFSTMTAYIAFVKLKACASDVTNIVASWDATPISQVRWQNTPCVTPWMQVNPLSGFVGKESGLGCVCSSGARYKLSGTGTTQYKDALSGPEPCLTNQTSSAANQYQCVDVMKNKIPSFPMKKWKNTYQCYATASGPSADKPPAVNAFGQTAPSNGVCALGTHLCGSAGDVRSFCEPDTTIGCPVNWMGSNAPGVLAQFNNPTGFTFANSGFTPVTIGGSTSYSTSTTEYEQIGLNAKVNVDQNWSPMPIVEMGMSVGVPCYGVDNAMTSQSKLTAASNMKTGTLSTSPVNLMVGLPDSCSSTIVPSTDGRYAAADYYGIGNLAYENYLLNSNNACAFQSDGTTAVSDINNVPNYNVYTGAAACISSAPATAPQSCLTQTLPDGISQTFTLTCATGDSYCNQLKKQTKCGLWQSMMAQTDNVGIFMKSQIYWKDDCVADKVAVQNSEKKLASSMKIQTALVVMNTIANVILIALGFRIAYLCYVNRDKPTSTYSDLEHIWKPRITSAASILKIPIVIATVASTGAIKSFFVGLSAGKCAGTAPASAAITNETFDQLGTQLPSIFTANVFVLLLDLVTFVPAIYAYVSHFCAYDDADSDILGDGSMASKDAELTKVPPPPPAPSGL